MDYQITKSNNILNLQWRQINREIALKCFIERKYCHWKKLIMGRANQIVECHRKTELLS